MNKTRKPIIGIFTLKTKKGLFQEEDFFRTLAKESQNYPCLLYFFTPRDIFYNQLKINAYTRKFNKWKQKIRAWPDLVIDRYYGVNSNAKDLKRVRNFPYFRFLNERIKDKWRVHQAFRKKKSLRAILPETYLYSRSALKKLLTSYPFIYLKPADSTGGRGVLKIKRKSSGYRLLGRNMHRHLSSRTIKKARLLNTIDQWVGRKKYIVQQGLDLALISNRVTDMRLLIQKNGKGAWEVTGYGMRIGGKNSPTSNLHGGGRGVDANSVLVPLFGSKKAKVILRKCLQLSHLIAHTTERHFGRMLELGLDIGIDVKGRIWLIEVNSRPGRKILKGLSAPGLYRKASCLPIEYALKLISESRKKDR